MMEVLVMFIWLVVCVTKLVTPMVGQKKTLFLLDFITIVGWDRLNIGPTVRNEVIMPGTGIGIRAMEIPAIPDLTNWISPDGE
jgi:hypothetical protein